MSRIECATCGLTPFDLPDDIDPEYVFEQSDGDWYCQVDTPAGDEDPERPIQDVPVAEGLL